jgi:hypothetical protein
MLLHVLMVIGLSAGEGDIMRQRIREAAGSPDKSRISEAFRLLEMEGLAMPAQDRIDLLCLAMATAQDQLHDESFVNRLVLGFLGNKAFRSLEPFQQDTVVGAVLGGERLPFRKGIDDNERFVQDRTVALLRWLTAMAAPADARFDPSKPPARRASPPAGYPTGIGPEAVSDPEERRKYQEAIVTNTAALNQFMHQYRLRQALERSTETVRKHLAELALTKERKARLRDGCAKATGISAGMVAAVFEPMTTR